MDKIKKKLGLYIRVSSEKQLREGFSFEDQEEKLIAEADREKMDYIVYKDGGISGTNTEKRDGLKQLLRDVELGLISKVYVTKISRLARNSRDLQNILFEFERNNVFFKSISDGIDTSTPMGNVMVKLMGIFAEMERDTIMEQTRAGLMKRAKEGKMYGSGPILGYDRVVDEESKKNTTKIIINEDEKVIIELIYSLYLGGYGYKAITNKLNKQGYRTKRRKLFSINTVKNTLENPLYAGFIRYGKFKDWTKKRRKGMSEDYIFVEGDHEAIVSKEDWEKVKDKMGQNQRRKTPVGSYLLSGTLTCPECGSKMVGTKSKYNTKKGPVERLYYVCSQYYNKGLTACHSNGIRVDLIDPVIISKVSEVFNSDELVDILSEYIKESTINESSLDGKIRVLELEIEKNNNRKLELRELYTEGIISGKELKEDIIKIDNKSEQYRQLIIDIEQNPKHNKSVHIVVTKEDIKDFLKGISKRLIESKNEEKLIVKQLLRTMINKISIISKDTLAVETDIKYDEILFRLLNQENQVG
jgi:site-specific DNA recombinase